MDQMMTISTANALLHLWSALMTVYLGVGSPKTWAESMATGLPAMQTLANRFLPAVADPVTPVRFELLSSMASLLTQMVTLQSHSGVKQAYSQSVEVLLATNMMYAEKRLPSLPSVDPVYQSMVHAWMNAGAEVGALPCVRVACNCCTHRMLFPQRLRDVLCEVTRTHHAAWVLAAVVVALECCSMQTPIQPSCMHPYLLVVCGCVLLSCSHMPAAHTHHLGDMWHQHLTDQCPCWCVDLAACSVPAGP
jgi:hypothetical protein